MEFPKILAPVNDPRRDEIDLVALFHPAEHGLFLYYGRLGQGKTYAMTSDIIEDLQRGGVWYVNYPIYWQGYDESKNVIRLIFAAFGLVRKFYVFTHENLHYLPIDEHFHDRVEKITDAKIGIDEGYVAYDSYEMAKLSLQKRKTILHARHYDRSFYITTQRPTSIHATLRGNINRFFRVQKLLLPFGIVLFKREEFDLGKDESVDEDNRLSIKWYFGSKKIFAMYDTKYLRGTIEPSQITHVHTVKLTYKEVLKRLIEALGVDLTLKRKSTPRVKSRG